MICNKCKKRMRLVLESTNPAGMRIYRCLKCGTHKFFKDGKFLFKYATIGTLYEYLLKYNIRELYENSMWRFTHPEGINTVTVF